jgi:hypothetical protein
MTTATASSNRTLMTISLAVPAMLALGSTAQAQSIQTVAAPSSSPKIIPQPAVTPVQANLIGRLGCPACRSGLDSRFIDKQPMVVNPVVKPGVATPIQQR